MTENTSGALSAEETAYFESGGSVELPFETTVETPVVEQETQVVEQQQPDERDEKGRFVPHGALHAEREERKKLASELQTIREQNAILNDRWNTLLQARMPEQQANDAPPNPEDDIFAFSKWQADQLKQLTEKVTSKEQAELQQKQFVEQERAVWNEWSQSAQTFAAQTPDFNDAVKFLSDARAKQLEALSFADKRFADPEARNGQINAELKQIVLSAKAQNISPAEAVYQISKSYGFAGKQPTDTSAADKLAQIDAAQNASRSLTKTPGNSGVDPMSAEAILAMPPREFEAWYKKPENVRRFNALIGG